MQTYSALWDSWEDDAMVMGMEWQVFTDLAIGPLCRSLIERRHSFGNKDE